MSVRRRARVAGALCSGVLTTTACGRKAAPAAIRVASSGAIPSVGAPAPSLSSSSLPPSSPSGSSRASVPRPSARASAPAPPGPAVFDVRWSEPAADGRVVCLLPPLDLGSEPPPGRPPLVAHVELELVAGDEPLQVEVSIAGLGDVHPNYARRRYDLGPGERKHGDLGLPRSTLFRSLCGAKAEPVVLTARAGDRLLGRSTLTRTKVSSVDVIGRPAKRLPHGVHGGGAETRLPCEALPRETGLRFAFLIEDEGPFRLSLPSTGERATVEVGPLDNYMMGGRVEHRARFAGLPVPTDACRRFPGFSVAYQHLGNPRERGTLALGFDPQDIEIQIVNEPAQIGAPSEKP